jgi:TonB family protein
MRRLDAMLILHRHPVQIVLVLLTGLMITPFAFAQDPPMDAVAANMADAISGADKRDVIVYDFSGPDRKITPFGQKLADEFSAALARSGAKIRVDDRSHIAGALKEKSYPLDFVDWGELAHAFAQELHVEAFVMGDLSIENDQLKAVISSYRADTGKNINSVQVVWPMSDEEKTMLVQDLANVVAPPDEDGYPNSGTRGYSVPRCLYCPRADYTPEAKRRHIQGAVELIAIVGEAGQFRDIRVLKPLPYGLTTAAINAIKTWRLVPAIGPDGKPATVRQIIEVTFQLY